MRIVRFDRHRAHHDLGAVGLEQGYLLRRHLVGHHEDALVPALGGDDRQADAGVAAGRLDDGSAGSQKTVTFGGEDHLERRTILGGSARVRRLGLEREDAVEAFCLADPLQANQRGIADQLDDRVGDLGALQARVSRDRIQARIAHGVDSTRTRPDLAMGQLPSTRATRRPTAPG